MLTPEEAYDKAEKSGGSNKLRTLACSDPGWAYEYALNVDKKPRDDTRESACGDPEYAYKYAHGVDGSGKEDTYRAVLGSEYQDDYVKYLNIPEKFSILKKAVESMRNSKEFKHSEIIC